MGTTSTAQPEKKAAFDPYAVINDKIVAKLENGAIPWQKLWGDSGQPQNLITGDPYKGINAILLSMEEYERSYFLSFDEVNSIGGKVRKGEKGHTVIKWVKKENSQGGDEGKSNFDMKLHTVFNVGQCDKIPDQYLAKLKDKASHPTCKFVLSSMPNPPKMQGTEPNTFYEVAEDVINLYKKKGAKKDMAYYAAVFRQLIHSTGHDSRLARKGVAEMSELADAPLYSREDLVGDIGLCFLLSTVGVHTVFKNGMGYQQGWLAKLKQDKKLVLIAAAQAQKAVDYILNVKSDSAEK